jgi:hypothetical protein
MPERLTEYEFVVRSIKRLRKPPYRGIHTVFTGFNQAFKDYFNKNPVEATQKLAQEGKIVIRPVKGGVMLYLPEDAPRGRKGNPLTVILSEDEPEEAPF